MLLALQLKQNITSYELTVARKVLSNNNCTCCSEGHSHSIVVVTTTALLALLLPLLLLLSLSLSSYIDINFSSKSVTSQYQFHFKFSNPCAIKYNTILLELIVKWLLKFIFWCSITIVLEVAMDIYRYCSSSRHVVIVYVAFVRCLSSRSPGGGSISVEQL